MTDPQRASLLERCLRLEAECAELRAELMADPPAPDPPIVIVEAPTTTPPGR